VSHFIPSLFVKFKVELNFQPTVYWCERENIIFIKKKKKKKDSKNGKKTLASSDFSGLHTYGTVILTVHFFKLVFAVNIRKMHYFGKRIH
jgi:hypothetical protein